MVQRYLTQQNQQCKFYYTQIYICINLGHVTSWNKDSANSNKHKVTTVKRNSGVCGILIYLVKKVYLLEPLIKFPTETPFFIITSFELIPLLHKVSNDWWSAGIQMLPWWWHIFYFLNVYLCKHNFSSDWFLSGLVVDIYILL